MQNEVLVAIHLLSRLGIVLGLMRICSFMAARNLGIEDLRFFLL